jgi:YegS/Rv2252/BmrU family lipid kinase
MALFPCNDYRELPEPGRVLFIVNPASGTGGTGGAAALRAILTGLAGTGMRHEVVETRAAGHARQIARDAVRAGGYDRLAAVGGDGTAMEVISGTIGAEMPVSVVPAGTGNVIAIETGTPLDLALACSLALSPAGVVPFDLGWTAGKYFAARLCVGLVAETIRNAAHGAKKKYGRLGYIFSALQAWRNRRLARYAIAFDDQIITRRAHTVFVTNVATTGLPGLNLASSCSPADGHFDLCILRASNAGELLMAVGSIVADSTTDREVWEVVPVYHAVEIRTVPRQRVEVDGEPGGVTPVMAAVLPKLARVVVPRTENASPAPAEPAPSVIGAAGNGTRP